MKCTKRWTKACLFADCVRVEHACAAFTEKYLYPKLVERMHSGSFMRVCNESGDGNMRTMTRVLQHAGVDFIVSYESYTGMTKDILIDEKFDIGALNDYRTTFALEVDTPYDSKMPTDIPVGSFMSHRKANDKYFLFSVFTTDSSINRNNLTEEGIHHMRGLSIDVAEIHSKLDKIGLSRSEIIRYINILRTGNERKIYLDIPEPFHSMMWMTRSANKPDNSMPEQQINLVVRKTFYTSHLAKTKTIYVDREKLTIT